MEIDAIHRVIGKNDMLCQQDIDLMEKYGNESIVSSGVTAFIEVGSFVGTSAIVLTGICEKLYCVDPFDQWYRQTFIDNLNAFQRWHRVSMIEGRIQNIPDLKFIGQVSFAFIDADKKYESTMSAFLKIRDIIVKGGHIAFHDFANKNHPDVKRVLADIMRDFGDEWSVVEDKKYTLFIKKVESRGALPGLLNGHG